MRDHWLYIFLVGMLLMGAACTPSSPSTTVQRPLRTVLLWQAEHVDTEIAAQWTEALCPPTDTAAYFLESTSDRAYFSPDSLLTYSAVIVVGLEGDSLSPQAQNALERYVESGGGLLLSDIKPALPYAWPWLDSTLKGPPPMADTTVKAITVADLSQDTLAAGFTLFSLDSGRIVHIAPNAWMGNPEGFSQQLFRSLTYAIGKNTYDYTWCQTPEAPLDNRFTIKVLDQQDVDEPMDLTVLPDGRVLFIEREGRMKLYLPQSDTTHLIHTFDVCTSGNYEDGLLGLACDPDFGENGFIYLYYSPGAVCEQPQTLSRFHMLGDSIDVSSERIILEVPVQRETCCHSGGAVVFGPDSCLWLSTGDNTSSKESDGYTPIDERPGRGPFDAQKSSGNTHDLRGKILRIRLTDSATYTIPEGNLFPLDGSQGRPEIYAMGCRNPFRISVDAHTGWVYWGDVGPDVGEEGRYGPESYDEWNQAQEPGNFGWPYFVGNNFAYFDRDFDQDTVGVAFDPIHPVNMSPYNTGSQALPPAQPAWIWYPYDSSEIFPTLGAGSRSAMAGPVYHRDQFPHATTAFPSYFEGKILIYEWARSWIKLVSMDSMGNIRKMEPFLPDFAISKPIDVAFGPDGALYMLEYGENYFMNNPEARLVKIQYAPGNRLPVPTIFVDAPDGAAPHSVNLSAYETFDHDLEDSVLRYFWQLTQDSVIEDSGVEICATFETAGMYRPRLMVVDQAGDTAYAETQIRVGNAPPEVDIAYTGNRSFFLPGQTAAYSISIQDPEDEAKGGLVADNMDFKLVYVSEGKDLDVMLQAPDMPQGDPRFYQGLMQIRNSDCKTCHAMEKESVGPSYQAIATRYTGDIAARDMLAGKIIKGGNGNWGERMMAAHPQHSLDDARAMVDYILSLNRPGTGVRTLAAEGAVDLPGDGSPTGAYLLAATYTDQGHGDLPPLTRRARLLLRYPRIEAEDFAEAGPSIWRRTAGENREIGAIDGLGTHAYVGYGPVDGKGITGLRFRYMPHATARIRIRLDRADGPIIGQGALPDGRADQWREAVVKLQPFEGERRLFLEIYGGAPWVPLCMLDWIGVELDARAFGQL